MQESTPKDKAFDEICVKDDQYLDPNGLMESLTELMTMPNIDELRKGIEKLIEGLPLFILKDPKDNVVKISFPIFKEELQQVMETYTFGRMQHYLNVIHRSLREEKYPSYNDINLRRWKEYNDVFTDSLWNIKKRDSSGPHLPDYHGNFVPQIPYQVLMRYTKKGDVVLDNFMGSGTTLIECRKLGRYGIGIELSKGIASQAGHLINCQEISNDIETKVIVGDSTAEGISKKVKKTLKEFGKESVQLVIMHPPYGNIIQFTSDSNDLSNSIDLEDYLERFGRAVDNVIPLLDEGRFLVLVIGDIYDSRQWIPIAHMAMEEIVARGFLLKSTVVKNIEGNRGKWGQDGLWRLRALKGGFYVFKHEYVFILQKLSRDEL